MSEKLPIHKRLSVFARSRLFQIEQFEVHFSNGEVRDYERIGGTGYGAVLIVPVTQDGQLLLIREYSAGVESYELAFPKGKIDAGEDALTAANRELQEEIGFKANMLTPLKTLSSAPGYSAQRTHIILAQDLHPSVLEGDEPEPLEVVSFALDEIDALMARKDFTEGRSIAALYLALRYLGV